MRQGTGGSENEDDFLHGGSGYGDKHMIREYEDISPLKNIKYTPLLTTSDGDTNTREIL